MFEKDYIMRMIQPVAKMVARVLFRIKSGRIEEASLDLQTAAERFLGFKLDMILRLSNPELIELLNVNGKLDVEKAYIAGQLLFCEANIRDKDNGSGGREIHLRSLDLLLQGFTQMDEAFKTEAVSTIDQILSRLGNQDLPMDIYRLLILYHEYTGEYSKAEDCLFALVENGFEEALQIGESFYSRLLKRTDQELERGNLPLSEVNEGLQDLKVKVTT